MLTLTNSAALALPPAATGAGAGAFSSGTAAGLLLAALLPDCWKQLFL